MYLQCTVCNERARFYIVQVYTDTQCGPGRGRGRRWEVYRCDVCGHRVKYAVT